jgi:hypothetical protein
MSTEVKPGQVWQDNDPRSVGYKHIILEITEKNGEPAALIRYWPEGNNSSGKPEGLRKILLRRYRPNSTGYRLIKDVTP